MNEAVDHPNCDREPIHVPSAIQPHGLLIAADAGSLRITHVSDNTSDVLGVEAHFVLSRPLEDVMGAETVQAVLASLDEEQRLPTGILTFNLPMCPERSFDITAHRNGKLICLEMERAVIDRRWDLTAAHMQRAVRDLRLQKTQKDLWAAAVSHIKAITEYDRVMVCEFDAAGNGETVAEQVSEGVKSYLGLHYPATDIPRQARELYLVQRIREIADVCYVPAKILAAPEVIGDGPLDLTYSGLRSVSPTHLECLKNMGVGATLAISLIYRGQLWGVIVCHHRSPKRLSPEIRSFCDMLGQLLSMLIDPTKQAEENMAKVEKQGVLDELVKIMHAAESIGACLFENAPLLMTLAGADGLCIQLGGQLYLYGETPRAASMAMVLSALRQHSNDEVVATDELAQILGDRDVLSVASGALMIRLNTPNDAVFWFRREHIRDVRWGGTSEETEIVPGDTTPHPRRPFREWTETQRGKSVPWDERDLVLARVFQRAITDALLRNTEAKLAQLSNYDPLTQLPNRRLLLSRLEAWRNDESAGDAAVLFLDIDHFKTINDSLGHGAGDELLRQVASRLASCIRERDLLVRLGGDEFVVVCWPSGVAEAEVLGEAVLAAFSSPFLVEGTPLRTTASVGIAITQRNTDAYINPLQAADSAMYLAKQRGGNQFVRHESPQHEKALRQLRLEQGLFHAIEDKQFYLVYQAQFDVSTLRLTGFEVLLRWKHPHYGEISPVEFIPLAEKTGQIVSMGYWVLLQAARQIADWRSRFGAELKMAVNFSVQQVLQNDFPQVLRNCLAQTALDASAIQVEVTESILMEDCAVANLDEARKLGMTVSVDDFGTGYSSLSYLQRLPIDELKIDRSFMEGVGENDRRTALFGAIIHMAHTLGMRVVAEGVETRLQLTSIEYMLCDSAQGHYLGRPATAEAVESELKTHSGAMRPRQC